MRVATAGYVRSMSSIWVRDATAADAPRLIDFVLAEAREAEGRSLEVGTVTASVTAALRDPALARYWLVGEGDAVVGAIAAVREWSDWQNAAYWWIQLAFLVPEARGRGCSRGSSSTWCRPRAPPRRPS